MKVIQNPIKECVINQIAEIDINRLTKIQAISENPLGWCNGLLFYILEYNDEYFNIKQSNGVWHIELFAYSRCETKPELLKYNGFQVEILDFTDFPTIEELTESIMKLRN